MSALKYFVNFNNATKEWMRKVAEMRLLGEIKIHSSKDKVKYIQYTNITYLGEVDNDGKACG